jgi:four helix bundle protein
MGFETLEVAKEAAITTHRAFDGVGGVHTALRDQALRAATSAALNVAEGAGVRGGNRARHWRIAHGSALEARTAAELTPS